MQLDFCLFVCFYLSKFYTQGIFETSIYYCAKKLVLFIKKKKKRNHQFCIIILKQSFIFLLKIFELYYIQRQLFFRNAFPSYNLSARVLYKNIKMTLQKLFKNKYDYWKSALLQWNIVDLFDLRWDGLPSLSLL